MIGERRVLGLIPARGGSKGLTGKNILPVNGRPLLAWTVDAARASRYIDRIVLSSDDRSIIAAGVELGCDVPFTRPVELAHDATTTMEVVIHALDQLPGYDVVVLLQPTSPLRTAADIDAACDAMIERSAPACVSVTEANESPYWMYRLAETHELVPVVERPSNATRRQDLPPVFLLNGAVYVAATQWLRESRTFVTTRTVAHVMPASRSLDIDTADDFERFKQSVAHNAHA